MFWDDFSNQGRVLSSWREFERLQREVNRLFTDLRDPGETAFPPVNVWTNPEGAIVSAELPGIDANKLDISVLGNSVTINGQREAEPVKEGSTYHRRERLTGRFTRTLEVPFRIESAKVTAEYKRGVLNINLPRAEDDRPKQIAIKAS